MNLVLGVFMRVDEPELARSLTRAFADQHTEYRDLHVVEGSDKYLGPLAPPDRCTCILKNEITHLVYIGTQFNHSFNM